MRLRERAETWCPSCRYCKPGRKSDCPIRLGAMYGTPDSTVYMYAERQFDDNGCRQWRSRGESGERKR